MKFHLSNWANCCGHFCLRLERPPIDSINSPANCPSSTASARPQLPAILRYILSSILQSILSFSSSGQPPIGPIWFLGRRLARYYVVFAAAEMIQLARRSLCGNWPARQWAGNRVRCFSGFLFANFAQLVSKFSNLFCKFCNFRLPHATSALTTSLDASSSVSQVREESDFADHSLVR